MGRWDTDKEACPFCFKTDFVYKFRRASVTRVCHGCGRAHGLDLTNQNQGTLKKIYHLLREVKQNGKSKNE